MNKYDVIKEVSYNTPRVVDKVIKRILKKENIKNSVFSIILVDDDAIRKLNNEYRKIDKVTDVISFALLDDARIITDIKVLGDIYISVPRMKKQALDYNHSETRELSFLVAHGLLHLLGYDHMNKDDEKIMFGKQEEVLNGFKETRKKD